MSLGLGITGLLGLIAGFAYLTGRAAGYDDAVRRLT
jgi:hypothetical protein